MGLVSLGPSSSVRGVITILEENKRHPVLSRRKRDPHAWGGGARDAVAGPRAEEAQRDPGEQCDPGALPAESDQRPPGRRVGRHRKPASPADGHTASGTRGVRCAARTVSAARFCGLRCGHDAARWSGRGQRFFSPPSPARSVCPGSNAPPPSPSHLHLLSVSVHLPTRNVSRHVDSHGVCPVVPGSRFQLRVSAAHLSWGTRQDAVLFTAECPSVAFMPSPVPPAPLRCPRTPVGSAVLLTQTAAAPGQPRSSRPASPPPRSSHSMGDTPSQRAKSSDDCPRSLSPRCWFAVLPSPASAEGQLELSQARAGHVSCSDSGPAAREAQE